jgi:hypothetical protein
MGADVAFETPQCGRRDDRPDARSGSGELSIEAKIFTLAESFLGSDCRVRRSHRGTI